MNNVDTRGNLIWNDFIRVPADREIIKKYQLNSGDVLFNNTNSTDLVGKSAIFTNHNEPVVYSNHFTRLRTKTEYLNSGYLASWLVYQWQKRIFENICNRWIGQSAVKADKLLSLELPLPPLQEQKRITAILNHRLAAVDKARAAAEAQLEAAKALPAAYLREVFPKPGQELPAGWKWVSLGEYTKKIGSGITPSGGHTSYLKAGIPLIRSQNVHYNSFVMGGLAFISDEQDELMEGSRVMKDDVLLNITGASIGRVCVVPKELCPANVNQHVSIIRCDKRIEPHFLAFYISTPDFQKYILDSQAGATRQALTKVLIENFKIPLPPLHEQHEISARLKRRMDETGKLHVKVENQLAEMNALPTAILRIAFSGAL